MTQRSHEPPSLDVHVYAEALARLQHHPAEFAHRILRCVGLEEPQWVPIRDQWIRLIEDDMERDAALVTAFAATFTTTRRRLLEHGESLPVTLGSDNVPAPAPVPSDPWAGLPTAMRGFSIMRGTAIGGDVPAQPVLPFSRTASPAGYNPPCGLSLEQAASLHVELTSLGRGASRGDVLRRYGLTGDQHQELTHFWGSRTATDPSLRERWEAACAAYHTWLLQWSQPR
jgi:hypothetical protein